MLWEWQCRQSALRGPAHGCVRHWTSLDWSSGCCGSGGAGRVLLCKSKLANGSFRPYSLSSYLLQSHICSSMSYFLPSSPFLVPKRKYSLFTEELIVNATMIIFERKDLHLLVHWLNYIYPNFRIFENNNLGFWSHPFLLIQRVITFVCKNDAYLNEWFQNRGSELIVSVHGLILQKEFKPK